MKATRKVKRSVLIGIAVSLICGTALARDIMVSGAGSGTAPDQATADSQAQQQATNQANALCPGTTSNVEFTSDNCAPITSGDNTVYLCTVTAKAVCHFGR